MKNTINKTFTLAIFTLCLLSSGCATLDGPPNPDDPYERFNRTMYEFNDTIDVYALTPLAKGYQAITPDAVDKGITNFFNNINDVVVLFNDLFQLKFEQAISDSARIVFNTTFGLFGFMDVATDFGLPAHDEDFGQTLGYWGVDSGPYLVLPLFGPSSIRDGVGFTVDSVAIDPLFIHLDDKEAMAANSIKYIDKRADLLKVSNIIDDTTPDPYAFIRDAWVQRRQNLVYDGNPPDTFNEDDLFEDDLFTDDLIR